MPKLTALEEWRRWKAGQPVELMRLKDRHRKTEARAAYMREYQREYQRKRRAEAKA